MGKTNKDINGGSKERKKEKRLSHSHRNKEKEDGISRDKEAKHIRDNNDAPLSPVLIARTIKDSESILAQNLDQPVETTPNSSSPTKKKKKKQHPHDDPLTTSTTEENEHQVPPGVPNLAEILSDPVGTATIGDGGDNHQNDNNHINDPDSKLPFREERQRRQQRETQGDDASGFLDDDDENDAQSEELLPGAVRIRMDGHETDDDDEFDNMEKNSLTAELRSSEFLLDPAAKNAYINKKNGARDHANRSYSAPRQFGSTEMASLPQAEHVTVMLIDGQDPDDFRKSAEQDAEKAFLSKVPTADLLGTKEDMEKRSRRVWIWALLAMLIVLLVIVGVVVGIMGASTRSSNDSGSPPDPLTFDNITDTEDLCQNALPLQFPTIVTGSTLDAASDTSLFGVCGSLARNGASGVWYSLNGMGTTVTLSTCYGTSFDTQISVFSGSSCSFAVCVEGSDQRTKCGTDGSHLTFVAEQGETYFILVHGLRRANGVFTLVINELEENYVCSDSLAIVDSDPKGEVTVFGSTKYSVINDELPECQDTTITSPGVWYNFIPQSTRFVQARLDDLRGTVTVFSGSCGSLRCVTADETGKAMWTASEGEKYFIFVHGAGKDTGDFALSVLAGGLLSPPADSNNRCILSQRLDTPRAGMNVSVSNTTANGLLVDEAPGCGKVLKPSVAQGLWYSVIGNGSGIRASTCDTTSGFIARVVIYEGDCQNLLCINGGDQNCGEESSVAWFAENEKEYFVLVEGLEARVGAFNLTLEEVMPSSSSDCVAPQKIPLDEVAILGSTEDGEFDIVGRCGGTSFSSPSVWYKVEGSGGAMIASTCDSRSEVFTKIEVYSGECSALDCTAVQQYQCGNQTTVVFNTVLGETYLIQVYGSRAPGEGDFTLVVEELPTNNECGGASEDLSLGSTILGSTSLPTSSGVDSCSDPAEKGSWYNVNVPSDQRVMLSACSGITNFEAKLTVFEGIVCGLTSCIRTNNGRSCGDRSFLTWLASASQTYYILVQGTNAFESGNFELKFGPQNDSCEAALGPIDVGGNPVRGSTKLATVDEGNLSCFSAALSVNGPGVWYTVVGENSYLKASTCSALTTFDTRISIYDGSCQDLTCVAGNDDDGECGEASSATWFASEGKLYFILVHGVERGDFELLITASDNNSCSAAYPLFISGSSDTIFSPQSLSETFIDDCTGEVVSNQIGSWYSVVGTGGAMRFDGCGGGSDSSQDSSLSVYNEECSDLVCTARSGSGCTVVVDTIFGEGYSVYVEAGSGETAFPLELDIYSSNNRCNSAFGPLQRGDVVRGSTVDATTDTVPLCGDMTSRGPGVWYTIIGTGETLTAFTCSEYTDFDTQMTLYQGDDCGNLECVGSRDDNCGTSTWVEHLLSKGTRYYILVSGKPGLNSVGNFELHVR